jgi:DNA modification methylase
MKKHKNIRPIEYSIPAVRQNAKRHYGVHPYFTRRPFNVVREYILHYSNPGDVVLDPFGGSGVTAIEALLENRKGIQNDINPLANFITQSVADLAKGEIAVYRSALVFLEGQCREKLAKIENASDREVSAQLKRLELPPNVPLPASADANFLYDLFEPKQLAALAIIREQVNRIENKYARQGMLLALSATLTKLNRTFLSAAGRLASRGGSSIFSIYRYKIAKEPVLLPLWSSFKERAENVLAAKTEIDRAIEHKRQTGGFAGEIEVLSRNVLDLPDLLSGKVDYIFTDPPYGGHIAYLDLSTMWNAWLGIMPSRRASTQEIIVGGDRKHTEETYVSRLGDSISACVKMLRKDRWLSVVFQHWNIAYFQAILTSAASSGAELRAAVSQVGDPIWSMHKKKGSASVLAGELILTFYKTSIPKIYSGGRQFDLQAEVHDLLRSNDGPLYGEQLFNRLVLSAWHKGALESLAIPKEEFSALLNDLGWEYDERSHYWTRHVSASQLLL